MDPRERAEELLARARARGSFVVTPDDATSPMDAANTVQIPRIVITANDPRGSDPESTMVLPQGGRPVRYPQQHPQRRNEQFQQPRQHGQQGQQGQQGQTQRMPQSQPTQQLPQNPQQQVPPQQQNQNQYPPQQRTDPHSQQQNWS